MAAKFAPFDFRGMPPSITGRDFHISMMPTAIRQAIEIKVKEVIGIQGIEKEGGGFSFVPISDLIKFLVEDKKYLNLPINIRYLEYINTWTNTFVHTGIVPFFWQSLEVIDLLEDLFSIEQNGSISLEGFKYRKPSFNINELKKDLEEYFRKKKSIFHLESVPIPLDSL